jgi:hypothetical protein
VSRPPLEAFGSADVEAQCYLFRSVLFFVADSKWMFSDFLSVLWCHSKCPSAKYDMILRDFCTDGEALMQRVFRFRAALVLVDGH